MARSVSSRLMAGIDVGGTFTDLVLVDEMGRLSIEKVPSTPANLADGVLGAIDNLDAARNSGGLLLRQLDRLVHGTTVAANCFLERKGARLGFITTMGLRDTLVMRRMFRENMYDTRTPEIVPLVSRINVFEVDERIDKHGKIVREMNEADVNKAIEEIRSRDLEAVGICFIFSFRNPEHELRVKQMLKERLPDVYVSTSFEVCPEIRDYERSCTTHLNAYLQPPCERYLRGLDDELKSRRASTSMQIMQSYGGVTGAQESADKPVNLLLSGPAGGVMASAYWGKRTGHANVISFDMGGTSCDISLIREGAPSLSTPITATATHCKFQGWDVLIPFIDIHTIGSGGGSVAWCDSGGGLHVGPQSVGAVPGPACYDQGGVAASVTDADLVLGYINPDFYLGGRIKLNPEKAREAVGEIGKKVDCTLTQAADGIFRITNASMINGIRVVSLERGNDPRDFVLMSFGGAGPVHATALMDELLIDRVIVPPTAAAFSAFGLLCTDLRHDYVATVLNMLSDVRVGDVKRAFRAMERDGKKDFGRRSRNGGDLWYEYAADMRYQGQAHEIRVPLEASITSVRDIIDSFNLTYHQAYGYLLNESSIQLVNLRVVANVGTEKPRISRRKEVVSPVDRSSRKGKRVVYFSEKEQYVDTTIYDGHALKPGNKIRGPAVVEMLTTTAVVRPGQTMRVDRFGNLIVARKGVQP